MFGGEEPVAVGEVVGCVQDGHGGGFDEWFEGFGDVGLERKPFLGGNCLLWWDVFLKKTTSKESRAYKSAQISKELPHSKGPFDI